MIKVHPAANKAQIRQAVESLFDVKVAKVRTMIRKGKRRMSGKRKLVQSPCTKKAIITLGKGYSLDLLSGNGLVVAPVSAASRFAQKRS